MSGRRGPRWLRARPPSALRSFAGASTVWPSAAGQERRTKSSRPFCCLGRFLRLGEGAVLESRVDPAEATPTVSRSSGLPHRAKSCTQRSHRRRSLDGSKILQYPIGTSTTSASPGVVWAAMGAKRPSRPPIRMARQLHSTISTGHFRQRPRPATSPIINRAVGRCAAHHQSSSIRNPPESRDFL